MTSPMSLVDPPEGRFRSVDSVRRTDGDARSRAASVDAIKFDPHIDAIQEEDHLRYLYDAMNRRSSYQEDDSISVGSVRTGTGMNDELAKFKTFQSLLDKVSEGCMQPVVMTDSVGVIRSVNREFLSVFGYQRWDVVGRNVKMIMPQQYAAKHDFFMSRYTSTKIRHIMMERRDNVRAMKKDGTVFPIALRIQELEDVSGSVFVAFIDDLTQQQEMARIESLFYSMMPKHVAERMRRGDNHIADSADACCVFFDIVGFTSWSTTKSPLEVVQLLTRIFRVTDIVSKKYGVLKIKTIGDCWMGASFLKSEYSDRNDEDNAYMDAPVRVVSMIMDVLDYIEKSESIQIRVGASTGPVLAGCFEVDKPNYDLLGSTVNLASRLQHESPINGMTVDERTYTLTRHLYEYHGPEIHEIRGIGPVKVWTLKKRAPTSTCSPKD